MGVRILLGFVFLPLPESDFQKQGGGGEWYPFLAMGEKEDFTQRGIQATDVNSGFIQLSKHVPGGIESVGVN